MAKKAKWLEESTNLDLINVIVNTLAAEEIAEKAMTKAVKAASELQERFEAEEATPSVEGLVNKIKELAAQIDTVSTEVSVIYSEEVAASAEEVEEVEEDQDDLEDDVEDEESDEDIDLTTLSKKALKDLCKEAGIKVKKGTSKEEMIEALTNN